jgi:hypothetical protein
MAIACRAMNPQNRPRGEEQVMSQSKTSSVVRRAILASAVLSLAPACATESDDSGGNDDLEIVGTYDDGFGTHEITADTWTIDGTAVFHIVDFDNEAGFVIAHNDEENEYGPGQWSRFDWTWSGDTLHYCQPVYEGADEAEARSGSSDPDDLETGCGGFPWSTLTPE